MGRTVDLLEILLVEDDVEERAHLVRSLRKTKTRNRVHFANDGVEAILFLRKQGPYEDAPTPDIVLLDQVIPRMSGREVLETMRRDPALNHVPVALLSSGSVSEALPRNRCDGRECRLRKPLDLGQFERVLRSLEKAGAGLQRGPAESPPAHDVAGEPRPDPEPTSRELED